MKTHLIALAVAAAIAGVSAQAAEPVKIGMITTLSGGGSHLGIDVRDGFALAIAQEASSSSSRTTRASPTRPRRSPTAWSSGTRSPS
jgi:branched-chain amino acid transport system substrate-binding protein